jgi:hypothetical protein
MEHGGDDGVEATHGGDEDGDEAKSIGLNSFNSKL